MVWFGPFTMSRFTLHNLCGLVPRSNGATLSRLAALACAVALGGGCQEPPVREWTPEDHGQPKPRPGSETRTAPSEDSAPLSPEEAEARATLALWNVTCASCHARDGKGGGPGLPPVAKVPDLTDPAFIATRNQRSSDRVDPRRKA